jgi:hypothetical protein
MQKRRKNPEFRFHALYDKIYRIDVRHASSWMI